MKLQFNHQSIFYLNQLNIRIRRSDQIITSINNDNGVLQLLYIARRSKDKKVNVILQRFLNSITDEKTLNTINNDNTHYDIHYKNKQTPLININL